MICSICEQHEGKPYKLGFKLIYKKTGKTENATITNGGNFVICDFCLKDYWINFHLVKILKDGE